MNPPQSLSRRLLKILREGSSRWVAFGIGAGLASGLVAVVFFLALEAATHLTFGILAGSPPPQPPGEQLFEFSGEVAAQPRPWLIFLLPAIGGLISGLIVYRFAPEAEGPGTDELIRAFHRGRGQVRPRVPLIKGIATVITLATGGSAGKEGPIAQIGSGIGSYIATRLGLSARDRRILLLAGAAGGLGAIFRAPLGSAITAIEVLYREDFEMDALIPCVLASVTAYVVFVLLLGGAQIFAVPSFPLVRPVELLGYLALALITVPFGRGYIWLFHALRERVFQRLPLPRPMLPMLGGLGVGVLGLWFPQVYGAGWGSIQQALDGNIVLGTMAFLAVAKILATSFTIGSGGSGGVFGPTLFIGGLLGGVIGFGGHELAPAFFPRPEAYVLVGMAAFFAGVASAPIGAMLMVAEMTGGYALLPPLMIVCVLSMVLARGRSIYVNQVKDRFHSPAHAGDLTINVLEEMKVGDVFRATKGVPTVPPGAGFDVVRSMIMESEDATVPVVGADGVLVGLLTAEQIRPVMDDRLLNSFVVAGDICAPPVSLQTDDDLDRAHQLFRASGCPQIPIVTDPDERGQQDIIGMLDYRDMMRAYERELARRREA